MRMGRAEGLLVDGTPEEHLRTRALAEAFTNTLQLLMNRYG